MKISGGKRNGKHLGKTKSGKQESGVSRRKTGTSAKRPKRSRGKTILRFLTVFFIVIIALISVMFAYYKIAVKPPPVKTTPRPPRQTTQDPDVSDNPVLPSADVQVPSERPELVYTFLVLGTDDGNWNTDTLMAVRFDAVNYKLNVVNIPRDTAVNVSWNTKKINSILSNELAYYNKDKDLSAKERKEKALSATVSRFADVLGFEVDYYVLVDMKAFEAMINAVGGVDFDLPNSMNYDDPAQNLSIHFNKGPNHFNGADALKIMRFRSGYASGDIGRIDFQQKFLMSVAQQLLAKKSSLNITTLADIFLNYMVTDLDLASVAWLGLELLKMDSENIDFDKMPGNYTDYVGKDSYVTIYTDEWLEMINEKLNPYTNPVTKDDVSFLYRGSDGKIYVTDGNYAYSNTSWGSRSSGGSSSSGNSSGSSGNSSGSSSASGTGSSGNLSSAGSQTSTENTSGNTSPAGTTPSETTDQEIPTDNTPPDDTLEPEDGFEDSPPELESPPPEPDPEPEQTGTSDAPPANIADENSSPPENAE